MSTPSPFDPKSFIFYEEISAEESYAKLRERKADSFLIRPSSSLDRYTLDICRHSWTPIKKDDQEKDEIVCISNIMSIRLIPVDGVITFTLQQKKSNFFNSNPDGRCFSSIMDLAMYLMNEGYFTLKSTVS